MEECFIGDRQLKRRTANNAVEWSPQFRASSTWVFDGGDRARRQTSATQRVQDHRVYIRVHTDMETQRVPA